MSLFPSRTNLLYVLLACALTAFAGIYMLSRLSSSPAALPDYAAPAPSSESEDPSAGTAVPLDAEVSPIAASSGSLSSNEEAYAFLLQEQKRMGIKKILLKDESQEAQAQTQGNPENPMTPDEARAYMREMTDHLTRINEQRQNKVSPVVPIHKGTVPQLISSRSGSAPVGGDAPAESSSSAALKAPPFSKGEDSEEFLWKRSWSGRTLGLSSGGTLIKDSKRWAGLWTGLQRKDALPKIRFDRDMVVLLTGPEKGGPIEIGSIYSQGPTLWVLYREKAPQDSDGAPFYHAVSIPRSDLQVSFEKIP
ncbi:MAG: hypothetical protein WCU88_07520 [Elusimicrobiota bacterium]|jgi:hypothetical protein